MGLFERRDRGSGRFVWKILVMMLGSVVVVVVRDGFHLMVVVVGIIIVVAGVRGRDGQRLSLRLLRLQCCW